MTSSLLLVFIGVLVVLFIVAILIITISAVRSRNKGKEILTITDPIPDERNPHTRRDADSDTYGQRHGV